MATKTTAVTEPALGSYVLYTGSKGTDKLALVVGNSTNFVAKDGAEGEWCEDCQENHDAGGGRPALAEGELVLTVFSISGATYTRRTPKASDEVTNGVWKPLA